MKGALIIFFVLLISDTIAIRKFNRPKKQELVVVDVKKQKSFLKQDHPSDLSLLQFGDAS